MPTPPSSGSSARMAPMPPRSEDDRCVGDGWPRQRARVGDGGAGVTARSGQRFIWASSGARSQSGLAGVFMSAKHAAAELARRTGLRDVAPVDVRELAKKGYLRSVSGVSSPLYDGADVERFTAVEELRRVGDARRAWRAASMDRWDAAAALGMSLDEFDAFAARRGLRPGSLGRYRRSEISELSRDLGDATGALA